MSMAAAGDPGLERKPAAMTRAAWDWQADLAANSVRRGALGAAVAYFVEPSFAAVVWIRLARAFRDGGKPGRIFSRFAALHLVRRFACHVSPYAEIGAGLRLPHPVGIVIGEGTRIGNGVSVYQHVTLGRVHERIEEYPTIEDGAIVYVGAVIIGGVTVGARAVVAANAVVNKDIPANAIAAGIPAKIVGTGSGV